MTVESPCIGLCRLDKNKVCIGCYRTSDEIASWPYADDKQKLKILESVRERRSSKVNEFTSN